MDYGTEAITKYGDDAARAIESGIEPSIINRLTEVEVTPSLYETLRITSPESAEYLREAYKNNPNISGRIEIVSERAYCDNCVDIVDQFQAEFKNIEVVRVETQ